MQILNYFASLQKNLVCHFGGPEGLSAIESPKVKKATTSEMNPDNKTELDTKVKMAREQELKEKYPDALIQKYMQKEGIIGVSIEEVRAVVSDSQKYPKAAQYFDDHYGNGVAPGVGDTDDDDNDVDTGVGDTDDDDNYKSEL